MLNDKKLTSFLFVFEGVGAVFVAVFLAAYLGGLFYTPQTTVLHSEPAFRIPLTIFGAAYLVLVLASIIIAVYVRKKR
jgi:type IV secretory pathway TrbL component